MKKTTDKKSPNDVQAAEDLANLTFRLEKICQEKEQYFAGLFNLTAIEFRCLRYIRENDNLTVKQLSENMNLTASRITYLITSLEKKDLITRSIDENDRRNIRVKLTESAVPLIKRADKRHVCLHREILSYIPEVKRDQVVDSLDSLFDAIKNWFAENRSAGC